MRKLLLVTLLTLIAAPAFAAKNADIVKAEEYLQALDKIEAKFEQSYLDDAGNKQVLTGTFYLDRPGRMRFEFNEIDDFIVADGFVIYNYDADERQQTNAPIGSTIADFLLRDKIAVEDEEIMVTDIKKSNGYTSITVTQRADPDAGSLTMAFSQIPYKLASWSVIDAIGTEVQVKLKDMKEVSDFDHDGLFMFRDPYEMPGKLNE